MFSKLKKRLLAHVGLTGVLLASGLVRLLGLNWDQGYHLHPDERMIAIVAGRLEWVWPWQDKMFWQVDSPMNPKFFAYGSLPLYWLKFWGELVSRWAGEKYAVYDSINLAGRFFSLWLDLAAVALVYYLAKTWWHKHTALLASLIYGLAVFPVQQAHFYTVDPWVNTFLLLVLYLTVRWLQTNRFAWLFAAGAALGLAMASKFSAVLGVSILLLAVGLKFVSSGRAGRRWEIWLQLASVVAVAVCLALVLQPYVVIDFASFYRQIQLQTQMAKRADIFVYTYQYLGTKPYLYPLTQIGLWGWGVMPLVISLILLPVWVMQGWRQRQWQDYRWQAGCLLLVWGLIYFGLLGRSAVKFMRYYLPLYPLLALGLVAGIKQLSVKWASLVTAVVLVYQIVWLGMFLQIYLRPNPRITASQWLADNLATGQVVAVEHWDDALPLPPWNQKFDHVTLALYEPDTPAKWLEIANQLDQAQAIVLSSNRLSRSIPRWPEKYPQATQYYQALFAGELGFELVAEFNNWPRLGSWQINDQTADESFYVYDHPSVWVFRKNDDWSTANFLRQLRRRS